MATSDRKYEATLAALDWVGTYEAVANEETYESIDLASAFEERKTASAVKRAYRDFPEDLVDAYAMLRRMARAQTRVQMKKAGA